MIGKAACISACAAALLLVTACSGPTYRTEHYTLLADTDSRQVEPASSTSLGVGPVRLPESLDRRAIVSHDEGQQLAIAPYAVWAGDLKDSITRVLADDLSSYLGSDQVWPTPWDNRVRPDRQVSIVFERFGGQRGGEVELQAKWRLVGDGGDQVLHTGKFAARQATESESYDRYAAALNELLHQLAWDIAQVVAEQDERAVNSSNAEK